MAIRLGMVVRLPLNRGYLQTKEMSKTCCHTCKSLAMFHTRSGHTIHTDTHTLSYWAGLGMGKVRVYFLEQVRTDYGAV